MERGAPRSPLPCSGGITPRARGCARSGQPGPGQTLLGLAALEEAPGPAAGCRGLGERWGAPQGSGGACPWVGSGERERAKLGFSFSWGGRASCCGIR